MNKYRHYKLISTFCPLPIANFGWCINTDKNGSSKGFLNSQARQFLLKVEWMKRKTLTRAYTHTENLLCLGENLRKIQFSTLRPTNNCLPWYTEESKKKWTLKSKINNIPSRVCLSLLISFKCTMFWSSVVYVTDCVQ